ncbi:Uncharacterised protein [Mycobacteroides abscessus subsp. abscessus]|nr:Uncharacterised protein [Mycobacteroides abscessus subsp. abscessus]
MECDHADDTDTNIGVKVVLSFHANFRNMVNQQEKQADQNTRSNEPELFPNNAENKISMAFRKIDFPCAIALSACFPRTDGKQGACQLESGRPLIIIGIDPGIDAAELVLFDAQIFFQQIGVPEHEVENACD